MVWGSHLIDDARGCLAGLSLLHSSSGQASTWSAQEQPSPAPPISMGVGASERAPWVATPCWPGIRGLAVGVSTSLCVSFTRADLWPHWRQNSSQVQALAELAFLGYNSMVVATWFDPP